MEPVFSFELTLPARGEGPIVRALHAQLRAAILDARLPAGAPLPATRRAAAALGVARNTVIAAYDLLVAEGYAIPRTGAKTVVAAVTPRRAPGKIAVLARFRDARMNALWRTPFLQPEPPRRLPSRCFRLGIPEHRHFPHAVWRRLSARAMRDWSKTGFGYAPSAGITELRAAIAGHVAFTRAVACTADDIVVTSGAQQAFDLIARALVTPGRTRVAVEDPGYPPLRAAFAAVGARLVPIPVDADGMCVERLPLGVHVISVTPSHQSPTGAALSLSRRTALLEYARRHDAVVIEDDYDGEFRFGERSLDALQTLDRDARVFYVGTFSKSLFPALRKGFVVAPEWAHDALVTVKHCADSHSDAITQAVLAMFIGEGHLARHVRRMRSIYSARREALLAGLYGQLTEWFEPIPSEAGLHLAARIRQPQRARKILAAAVQHLPGSQSIDDYALSPPLPPALAVGYGVIDAEAIAPALEHLHRSLRR